MGNDKEPRISIGKEAAVKLYDSDSTIYGRAMLPIWCISRGCRKNARTPYMDSQIWC